ncbi:hypothetical protein [Acaricomes phytoseiuli]|uniref:hypothetical protein n=1 Tax=Acaricomes phytoseiuli TaxID=291968 RepID=UPI0003765061|nr:hypothetical protein [Acaricomes phytoseiuli]
MKYLRRSLFVLVALVIVGLTSAQASLAAPVPNNDETPFTADSLSQGLTPEQFQAVIADLKNSSVPQSEDTATSLKKTTFTFPQGFSLTFVEDQTIQDPTKIQLRIGGGTDSGGSYILFNQFDQDMLMSGSGALLNAAICAIPGVGWAACAGVTALVIAATIAVSNAGKCPGQKQMKLYVNTLYRSCV